MWDWLEVATEWRKGVFAVNGDAPTCYRKREMHLYSETLNRSVTADLRRLTFDISGRRRAQPFDCPLDGRVRRLAAVSA